MSSPQSQPPVMTSLERVSHIPIVSCGMSSLHATLSTTPLLRTAYNMSLAVSSRLMPYVSSASAHYPFAPVLVYGDRTANKTLDIAQQKWPYPFQTQPEQVWNDVRSAADTRVVKPAVGVAKSVDQHLSPLVDSFSFVVNKIDADADKKVRPSSTNDYQLGRAYALLLVLRDDIIRTANNEENTVIKNIHIILTRLSEHSAALRSHSEDAAARMYVIARAVLAELDKLAPLVTSVTSNTSSTLRDTAGHIRSILTSNDPLGQKLPRLGVAIQDGVSNVIVDVTRQVHEIVEEIRSNSSKDASQNKDTLSKESVKGTPKRNKRGTNHTNGISGSPSH